MVEEEEEEDRAAVVGEAAAAAGGGCGAVEAGEGRQMVCSGGLGRNGQVSGCA